MNHPPNSRQGMMACGTERWRARRNRDRSGQALAALPVTLTLAVALMATLVWMVGFPTPREVQAMPAAPLLLEARALDAEFIRVATTGENSDGCGVGEEEPCATVQYAVDKAGAGDEIRVAAGTYNESEPREGLTQVVYIDKSLTILGGYTTSDWTTPDPDANPTTLDAEGAGRVMVISPTITVHLEGLRFVGGNATGLGGGPDERDAGGGLYILTSTVTISDSLIFSNTASVTGTVPGSDPPLGGGFGGGLYFRGGSLKLTETEIVSNTAGVNFISFGGGLYLDHSDAIFSQNILLSNTASYRGDGQGGGLYLEGGASPDPLPSASLLDNTFQGNYASRRSDGLGGGMFAKHYSVELKDNLVQYNTAGTAKEGKGGGLYIFLSEALLERNLVRHNVASRGEEGISGGVHFCTCPDVTLKSNTVFANTASTTGNGNGGGVSFCKTTATLDSNAIISNTATLSTTAEGWGGGVWTGDRASLSVSNDVIAGNEARTQGAGLWVGVETLPTKPEDRPTIRLQHVTIADNSGGIGHGIYVTRAVAHLTNTIIASHTVGIYVDKPRTGSILGEATLEATLWYNNEENTDGWGYIETGDNNYEGNPAFVDPETWDYHIGDGSAALDRGVATGVRSDMDAQPRPWLEPDLGADEYWPASISIRAYLPLILRQ